MKFRIFALVVIFPVLLVLAHSLWLPFFITGIMRESGLSVSLHKAYFSPVDFTLYMNNVSIIKEEESRAQKGEIHLSSLQISVSPTSFLSSTVQISRIFVDTPLVVLASDDSFLQLPQKEKKEEASSVPKKMRIDLLEVSDGKIKLDVINSSREIHFSGFVLKNLETDGAGFLRPVLVFVIKKILASLAKNKAKIILEKYQDKLKQQLEVGLQRQGDALKNQFRKVTERLSESLKKKMQ